MELSGARCAGRRMLTLAACREFRDWILPVLRCLSCFRCLRPGPRSAPSHSSVAHADELLVRVNLTGHACSLGNNRGTRAGSCHL